MKQAFTFGPTMTLSRNRLLIVEDNHSLLQMLRWEFEELGYLVSTATCCSSARKLAKAQLFDLALLDCNLPDGCGSALMLELQQKQPELPVILCSGAMAEEQLMTGAYRFVTKPVSAKSLHLIFQQALGHNPPSVTA